MFVFMIQEVFFRGRRVRFHGCDCYTIFFANADVSPSDIVADGILHPNCFPLKYTHIRAQYSGTVHIFWLAQQFCRRRSHRCPGAISHEMGPQKIPSKVFSLSALACGPFTKPGARYLWPEDLLSWLRSFSIVNVLPRYTTILYSPNARATNVLKDTATTLLAADEKTDFASILTRTYCSTSEANKVQTFLSKPLL